MEYVVLTSDSGVQLIVQASNFGVITNLGTANFKLPGNKPFTITNEHATDSVTLEVIPAGSSTGEFVPKVFKPGDSTFVVKEVKLNATAITLLWAN